MKRIKVVVTDYIEPDLEWEASEASKLNIDFYAYQKKSASPQQLLTICSDADVLIVNMAKINAEVIDGLSQCKLIVRHGVGYDNVDINSASRRKIAVGYVPDYCINEVAEQAVMLMMVCQRRLVQQIAVISKLELDGQWDFSNIDPIYRLNGKTVGIVGFGRIGSLVYRLLQGFDIQFLITDPYLSEARKHEYNIDPCPFEHLLKNSDIITIHCPLKLDETYHMFDTPQFIMMKPMAILINTARGGITNLVSLDKALRAGYLGYAGIDVYETEPPSPDFSLLSNPKAICTPHLSWISVESSQGIREKIMEDLRRFLKGQMPVHQINHDVVLKFST